MSKEMLCEQQARDTSESRRMQAMAQVMESAVDVRRRPQFFMWTQAGMQALLPHKLAICGAYDRARKEVKLDAFNSVVIPPPVIAELTNGQSVLMQSVIDAWIANRGCALVIGLATLSNRATEPTVQSLQSLGFTELLVHGVSRPQRPREIETLFVFASPGQTMAAAQVSGLELLMPQLHSTYLRVQSTELGISQAAPPPTLSAAGYAGARISEREEQVLGCAREGMSNQEIGLELGISPLTVKNHVQNILRKLGAANRAQAVARAMSMNLLTPPRAAALKGGQEPGFPRRATPL